MDKITLNECLCAINIVTQYLKQCTEDLSIVKSNAKYIEDLEVGEMIRVKRDIKGVKHYKKGDSFEILGKNNWCLLIRDNSGKFRRIRFENKWGIWGV